MVMSVEMLLELVHPKYRNVDQKEREVAVVEG